MEAFWHHRHKIINCPSFSREMGRRINLPHSFFSRKQFEQCHLTDQKSHSGFHDSIPQDNSGAVENKWPTFQDGISKGAFSPFFRVHVLEVRSTRKTGCGLAGRTFLNSPDASDTQLVCDRICPLKNNYSTLSSGRL